MHIEFDAKFDGKGYPMIGPLRERLAAILSFLLAVPAFSNFNANDQLTTHTYDNDGNTTASNGVGYVFDFENHVIQAGAGITMVCDSDGSRVQKTVAGVASATPPG